MPTLIYAPEVTIRIRTSPQSKGKGKVIDVTEDVSRGRVTRVNQGVSTASFTLLNQSRKYDGVFSPMDTVVIYMRRIKTVLKFSGYLDSVPKWAANVGSINLTASCSLKRLQYWYWDPSSPAGAALLSPLTAEDRESVTAQDGGLSQRAIEVLTQVVGWPKAQIHIGRVPENWYDKVGAVADQLIAESEALAMSTTVGSGSRIGGENPLLSNGTQTVQGIGPGTGRLPATRGRISHFGGPGGGAYGNMGLTGESGVNPRDPWYCAMRWPYTNPDAVKGAKDWWVNRKILVVNPKNNKSVVLRAADWGPHISTGRVIDVGPQAMKALGASTDDIVNIAFAPTNVNLGPISRSDASLGGLLPSTAGVQGQGAGAIKEGWGAPGDESNIVSVTAGGRTFRVHRLARTNFMGFVNDLVNVLGYRPQVIGGYNDRNIAGTSRKSNHAWGAAIDIDPSRNPYYASGSGGPYALPKKGLVQLARKWGLGWGGEWNNSKDYMHFEVIGAPASDTYDGVSGSAGAVVIQKWQPPLKSYTLGPKFGETGPSWASKHSGTDFQAPAGTPIYPVGPGKVHDKGTGDSSYGNWISIDHGGKNYTFYAHMQAGSSLAIGEQVGTGTVLGRVGSTGNASGPHVHVEYRRGADTYAAALASGGIEKYVLGGANRADPPAGSQMVDGDYSQYGPAMETNPLTGEALFNLFQYQMGQMSQAGVLLGGARALMNDVPVMNTISELMTAGLRDYCSAPNGDFIAWFPDYFGHYKQAGKMIVSPLEISGVTGPPTIGWSDAHLKTHQYVSSASWALAGDADALWRQATTAGIASVEYPELLMALLNINRREAEEIRDTYLERYGARPEYTPMNSISGPRQEFFFACHKFQQNWTRQFQAQINLYFMPELYPGMLLCIPEYGIQGYIEEVTDEFDLTEGGQFSTTASCSPWSSIGRSKKEPAQDLPIGAPL